MARGRAEGLRSALVLISHDRRFLEGLSQATVWLDRGITRRHRSGLRRLSRPGATRCWSRRRPSATSSTASSSPRRDWLRYGVTARRKRNVRRLAEPARSAPASAASDRGPPARSSMTLGRGRAIRHPGGRGGGRRKSFGERAIVRDLSLRILRGDRLGIVGPNGAGKTTLINLLTGVLPPDEGRVRLGANLADGRPSTSAARASIPTPPSPRRSPAGAAIPSPRRPAQACRRLHEGLPLRARAGAHPGRRALRRRAQPPDAGPRPGAARRTSSSSTSRPTTSTSKPSTSCRR